MIDEAKILAFWEQEKIFEKSLAKPAPKGDFIFYEGPPTANGKPGIHHLESRAFKDAIPRYKTMRGYRVARRAGWDTHGLPVELEVEKQLGFSSKKDIEQYGVAAFNQKCRESVLTYIDLWEKFTRRIGYWVDQGAAYFTYDASYMEAVWGVLAAAAKSGRLYKDYRVVPWCPHDGTALSSHELAQGYQDVKDLTVTAKFKVRSGQRIAEHFVADEKTYLLAWTTTPWTLPGNVALAVLDSANPLKSAERYIAWKDGDETIIASGRYYMQLQRSAQETKFLLGAGDLVGLEYEPLYPFARELAGEGEKAKFDKAFKVYAADFVTTEDGTGIVHTAVMYGQEDFELGNKIGLPKVHLVNPEGRFISGTGFLENKSVVDEETTVEIIKDLAARGLLFAKAKHDHTYPFCWRCKTRLIYYARDSWYIRMHDLRDKLVAANKTVGWVPEHIKEGRMGEWLANAKDWAISRERYWGTPLPVWQSADGAERVVIGSVDELKKRTKKSGNKYFFMRHGQTEHNVEGILSFKDRDASGLTEKGKEETRRAAEKLKEDKISVIYTSPYRRTKETAYIVADVLGIPRSAVVEDERLHELNAGDFDGGQKSNLLEWEKSAASYHERVPGGESYADAKRRFGDFLYEIEERRAKERILVVTHGIGVESAEIIAEGGDDQSWRVKPDSFTPKNAEVRRIDFIPLPHNDDYELDLHKPYIDAVTLVSEKGTELTRVSEVMDVWLDSGAMPFAQAARERGAESLEAYLKNIPYPADFISEAIDQTRGWFYTLLAVGTLMGRAAPYKHVICLGHLLDANGKKMSKSVGNVVDPFAEVEKWGADTLRFWMYYVNQPGDSKNYDEKTVKEAAKVLGWLENSTKFYVLFKDSPSTSLGTKIKLQTIDFWMTARTQEAAGTITKAMEEYDLYTATRELASLAEDLSQWYVRRIRDRAREGDAAALATLRSTLRTIALLIAPFAPFIAEDIFAAVKDAGDPESVHLAAWPHSAPTSLKLRRASNATRGKSLWFSKFFGADKEEKLIEEMRRVREIASQALQLRQQANIKVRQPLSQLAVGGKQLATSLELLALLAEEVNVKRVVIDPNLEEGKLVLDTVLTPELVKEGDERAMARAVAEARKQEGLSMKDRAHVVERAEGKYAAELSTGPIRFDLHHEKSRR